MQHAYRYKSSPNPSRRELNWKLLLGTLVVLATVFVAGWLWHQRQLRSLREAFLERAHAAETEGRHSVAANYLFQYLRLTKDGTEKSEMLERIAKTRAKGATTLKGKFSAIEWYYRAVGAAPNRTDLHASLSRLLLETGQFSLAAEQAEAGLAVDANDQNCQKARALARFGLFRQGTSIPLEQLTREFVELNNAKPHDVEVATTLARIYRAHNPVQEETPGETANQIIDTMVRSAEAINSTPSNDASLPELEAKRHEPFLARYLYRTEYEIPGAADDITAAVDISPTEPIVLLTGAEAATKAGNVERALELYQSLAKVDPENSRAHLGIGQSLQKLGQTELAIRAWKDGLEQSDPNDLAINVRLGDTLLGLQRIDEADAPINRVQLAIERLSSTGREHLRDWAVASSTLLRAKRDIARQNYPEAIAGLHRVAATSKSQLTQKDGVTLSYQAWVLLGRTYGMLEQWEDAAISFDRGLEVLPSSLETRFAAAQAWAATGRLDKAIVLCEQIVHRENAPAAVWSLLAKLHLQLQLRSPPAERHWQGVASILAAADKKLPDAWEMPLIRVNYLMVSQPNTSIGESMQILLNAEQDHRNEPEFWSLLARTYQAMNQASEADRALETLHRLTNSSFAARLVSSDLLSTRGRFERAREVLSSMAATNDAERRQLRTARVQLEIRAGDSERINTALLKELQADPQNLQLLGQLTDLAFEENRNDEFAKWLSELRRIEGENGTQWRYYQARQLLRDSNGTAHLESVNDLLRDIELRPWWPGGTFLRGLVADRQGKSAEAVAAYSTVLKSGLQTPEVYRRLLQTLYDAGRISDAEQYARMMQQRYPLTRTFTGSTVGANGQDGQLRLATQIAQAAATRSPTDMRARRWLGRMLMLSGEFEQAERELKAVAQLDSSDLHARSMLFSFYLQTNQMSKAASTVATISNSKDINNREKDFVLAQAYQLLGNGSRAEAHYQEAIRLQPTNLDVMLRYALFLSPFDMPRAEKYARLALKVAPENKAARRVLAMVLGNKFDPAAQTEATSTDDPRELSGADQRLRAILLLRRGTDEDVKQAEQILRDLSESSDTESIDRGDRLLLAHLSEQRGDIPGAAEQYAKLTEGEDVPSRYIASHVGFLIRQQEFAKAESWLQILEKRASNSLLTVRLRYHLLAATGRSDLARQKMESYAETRLAAIEGEEAAKQFMLSIAESFVTLGQADAADEWYQRFNDRFPGNEEHLA
ncbi:tetratricopeptide repeat protein, partial [Planctomycetota bacterium]